MPRTRQKFVDLVGQRFGRLFAIERAENRRGKVAPSRFFRPTVDQQRHAAEARAQALADELADAADRAPAARNGAGQFAGPHARGRARGARALRRRFAAADENSDPRH